MFTSCVSTKLPFSDKNKNYSDLNISMRIDTIMFIDERDTISTSKDIKLPIISIPGDKRILYPCLTEAHKKVIAKTIYGNFKDDSLKAGTITVYIKKAEKEFTSNWISEKETVRIKLKVNIKHGKSEMWTEVGGESYITSLDANKAKMEALYNLSLMQLTYQSLSLLKEGFLVSSQFKQSRNVW